MSVYGLNNACSLDALLRLKGKGRGIACIDPDAITDAELNELHSVGFRGIRLNLRTRSQSLSPEQWARELPKYANRIRRLGWAIQSFVSMPQIASIAPIIPQLGVKIVIDHLGHPEPDAHKAVLEQPGCAELYKILAENKNSYVKLSGTYRLEGVLGVDEHMGKLLKEFPDQIVWASDWPHTAGPEYNPGGDSKAVQEFLKPDIIGFLKKCWELCKGDENLVKKIWVDNPKRLWDYSYNN